MGRLKGISAILSPDLLHALSSMGHGDEIVLADANFPTSSICRDGGAKEIRADGHQIPAILEAILQLMPLDTYCWSPASVMDVTDSDRCKGFTDPPVWAKYRQLLNEAEKRTIELQTMERFDFYDRARKAFAIVHTGETALYGNIILKMGVIDDGVDQSKSS